MTWQTTAALFFLAPFGFLALAFTAAETAAIVRAVRAERRERRP
jgi:hypothetical protein